MSSYNSRTTNTSGVCDGMPGDTDGESVHSTVDTSDGHSMGHHHFTHQHSIGGGHAPMHTHTPAGHTSSSPDLHGFSNTGTPHFIPAGPGVPDGSDYDKY